MNSKEYVKNVLVTEARDFSPVQGRLMDIRNIRLLHASAGISSEIAELIELSNKSTDTIDRVNLMEECGDILWYVGIAADSLNAVDDVCNNGNTEVAKLVKFDDDLINCLFAGAAHLAEQSGEFADLAVKKLIFYGKPFDKESLVEILTRVHLQVKWILEMSGYTVEQARERNIAKLKARYGEKFTEAAALERNLTAERATLETK